MDSFFGLEKANSPSEDLELLLTVNDRIYQSIVESVLKDNDIPFFSKERGSGSAVKIITGFSLFGTDIFVLKRDFDRAKELMEILSSGDGETFDDEECSVEYED
jgi:hypothetical protein